MNEFAEALETDISYLMELSESTKVVDKNKLNQEYHEKSLLNAYSNADDKTRKVINILLGLDGEE